MAVCGVVVRRELEYWNLKETLIHPCCWVHYCTNVNNVEALDKLNRIPKQEQQENADMLTSTGVARVRLTIWRLMCRPNSTKYAQVCAYSKRSMQHCSINSGRINPSGPHGTFLGGPFSSSHFLIPFPPPFFRSFFISYKKNNNTLFPF